MISSNMLGTQAVECLRNVGCNPTIIKPQTNTTIIPGSTAVSVDLCLDSSTSLEHSAVDREMFDASQNERHHIF